MYARNHLHQRITRTNTLRMSINPKRSHVMTSDIVQTLEHVNNFISVCYGTTPKDNWEHSIDILSESWSNLHSKHNISITNKIHKTPTLQRVVHGYNLY